MCGAGRLRINMSEKDRIIKRIAELKKKRNAVILAHVYQRGEVQDIADYVGDSLGLSRKAVDTDADVIVFCGVRFMAETASILNPEKTVLLPENEAGCPLADMATVEELREMKKKYPDAVVVSYINSSAAVKAASDICCTSANAVDVVNSVNAKKVLFLPDKNLGSFVASQTDKEVILWDGYCYVHEKNITVEKIEDLKKKHPDALVLVHPECNQNVVNKADFAGSTSQMQSFAGNSDATEFIIGTENGLVYRLQKDNPDKKFYPVDAVCKDMKLITLESVVVALKNMEYKVAVSEDIRYKAKNALDKMLKI
jgi:quinolinate synthase